jgi:short-subunit dehydrogenase
MAKIFITASADGLGQLAVKSLADQGHQIVLHARNVECEREVKHNVPNAEHVIAGDLSDVNETKSLAAHRGRLRIKSAGYKTAPAAAGFITTGGQRKPNLLGAVL